MSTRVLLQCILLLLAVAVTVAVAATARASATANPAPPITWEKGYTFGAAESHPHAGVQTSDGGFLVVGDGVDCEFWRNFNLRRGVNVARGLGRLGRSAGG